MDHSLSVMKNPANSEIRCTKTRLFCCLRVDTRSPTVSLTEDPISKANAFFALPIKKAVPSSPAFSTRSKASMLSRIMSLDRSVEENRKQAREMFDTFDVNGDGQIEAADLTEIFRNLGDDDITEAEIRDMIIEITGSGKGSKVTFEEFFRACSEGCV